MAELTGKVSRANDKYNNDMVEHYQIYRAYLQHEDDLINHRSTWNHTIQGLLFAALGLALSRDKSGGDRHIAAVQRVLVVLLPMLGMVISTASLLSILAASKALNALRDQWIALSKLWGEDVWPTLPHFSGGGDDWALKYGKSPALLIPLAIGVAWLCLLIAALWCFC